MSSPNRAEIDLKEGHALPATKLAGGIRVKGVKPHKHHSTEKTRSHSESDEIEETNGSPKQYNPIISGAQTKGNADFQPEAIRAYHDKPFKVANKYMNGTKDNVIQQPKKF